MEDEKIYKTSDFYLSAFFLAEETKLIEILQDNPRRIIFVFEFTNDEDKNKMVEDFLYNRALVEPKQYAKAIKDLKQLIHSII